MRLIDPAWRQQEPEWLELYPVEDDDDLIDLDDDGREFANEDERATDDAETEIGSGDEW